MTFSSEDNTVIGLSKTVHSFCLRTFKVVLLLREKNGAIDSRRELEATGLPRRGCIMSSLYEAVQITRLYTWSRQRPDHAVISLLPIAANTGRSINI